MVKILNGSELAGYIKQRHARQVRALRHNKIYPKLAIVQLKDDPVINTYVRLKREYGSDIGVDVEVHKPHIDEAPKLLNMLSNSGDVHGIIVQLPLPDPSKTNMIVNLVDPGKDVDSLGDKSIFEPATPMAILWLLAAYNVELAGKQILIIGRGKLVGEPLEKLLRASGLKVAVATKHTGDIARLAPGADVIISAANEPEILSSDMVKNGAVVVDAGVAEEGGKTVGNLAPDVYQRHDISVTPHKGGVGPLTVCALFENVIRAAGSANQN